MTGLQSARDSWLPLAIVAGLVLATTWLGQLAEAPRARGNGPVGHVADYFVEDFSATAYDTGGAPRYRLNAVRMTHYLDDDSTELLAPRFSREGEGMARVVVRSLRALVSSDGEKVHFLGDVRMMHERLAGGVPMELSTDSLWVEPDQNRMATDRPVVVQDGRGELRGGAMRADGKARTLELTGRVKGIYENRR
jgi:lipopolysaccharide export system protein LptC